MTSRNGRRRSRRPRGTVLAAVAVAVVLAVPAAAGGATFAVTTSADGPGTCPGTPCTLRAAVAASQANGNGVDDTITLPAGDFALTAGELMITGAGQVTIDGAGPAATRIRQTGEGRVLHATAPGGPLRLTGLTVQGGRLPADDPLGDGAGIRSNVGLELERVVVYDNRSAATGVAADGGGVAATDSDGHVQITDSTFARNRSLGRGGGVAIGAEQITIRNVLVTENAAGSAGGMDLATYGAATSLVEHAAVTANVADGPGGQGGGLAGGGLGTGPLALQRSLVAGNRAAADGGAWILGGSATASAANVTFSGNVVDSVAGSGAITKQAGSATLTLAHATFAQNRNATGPTTLLAGGPGGVIAMRGTIVDGTCAASPTGLTDQGFNVVSGSACTVAAGSSAWSTDPLLAPLADNGGRSATHAITTASPASARATAACPLADQRDAGRTPTCDSGAFEAGPSGPPSAGVTPPPAVPDRDGDGTQDADDACPDVAAAGGCPPPADPGPAPPPAGVPAPAAAPATPRVLAPLSGASPRAPRRHAALAVTVASLRSGRLTVCGTLARTATGRVRLSLRAAGRTTRFTTTVRRGAFRLARRLPGQQRRARSGRLTIAYAGDARTGSARAVLTAGSRSAGLRVTRARLAANGDLQVAGRIARAATGTVTVLVEPRSGAPAFRAVRMRAPVRAGRWSVRRRLAAAAARGGRLTITYGGRSARRVAGRRLTQTVAPR